MLLCEAISCEWERECLALSRGVRVDTCRLADNPGVNTGWSIY